jgi:alkanesulfonate monooxygenase SsuD/methylene tetrahydromethanopterin reductase-like flavin-dependent oxidoreductase (luciferase family)
VDVGVQIHPQHGSAAATLAAWRRADDSGFSSIWTWDHVSPLKPGAKAASLEAWTLLAAAATVTDRARIGILVCCISLRAPELVADMARTVNEIGHGRLVLGLGAGWRAADCTDYRLGFPGGRARLAALDEGVERIRQRLADCGATGIPIMIGGGRATLAQAARCSAWNFTGPAGEFAALSGALDRACARAGRTAGQVARSVLMRRGDDVDAAYYARAGASELVLGCPAPFDLGALKHRRDRILAAVTDPAAVPSVVAEATHATR